MSILARAIPGPNGAIVCDRTLSNFSKVKSLDCSGGPSYPPARVGRFPTKTPSPFVCAYLWHPQHCGRAAVSWTSPVLGCGSVASWPGVRVAPSAPTRPPPGARGALPGGVGHPSRRARSAPSFISFRGRRPLLPGGAGRFFGGGNRFGHRLTMPCQLWFLTVCPLEGRSYYGRDCRMSN